MLIVYRKSDKEIVFNSGKSFVEPQGMSDLNGKLTVIELIGGEFNDYGVFRLHDDIDVDKVDEILKYQDYVKLLFDGDTAIDYTIDYLSYNLDKSIKEEDFILGELIPSNEELFLAEIELNILMLLLELEAI